MALRLTVRVQSVLLVLSTTRAISSFAHPRLNSSYAAPSALTTANLECERKFLITDLLRSELAAGKPIQNLHFKKADTKIFQDKYFDFGTRLLDRGIWLRLRTKTPHILRSGVWEAKMRIGSTGDYINSKFEEVSGERDVHAAIKKRYPIFSLGALKLLGYQELTAVMSTERETWEVNSSESNNTDFKIVLDKVRSVPLSRIEEFLPFEHVVGEVEATKTVQLSDDVEANETFKQEELARMDLLLKDFMVEQDLFPTQPAPVGKLSAYFEWKQNTIKKQEELQRKLKGVRR
jgi:hypothetical protein